MANKRELYNLEPMIVEGKVKFSNLQTPMSFDAVTRTFVKDEDKGSYSITVLLNPDDPALTMIEKAHEDAGKHEKGQTTARVKLNDSPLREDVDDAGHPTGLIAVRLKRGVKKGTPTVAYSTGADFTQDYINHGSDVKVQLHGYSYNVGNNVGLSLVLDYVAVVNEAPSQAKKALPGMFSAAEGKKMADKIEREHTF